MGDSVRAIKLIQDVILKSDGGMEELQEAKNALSVMKVISLALRPSNRKKLNISSQKPLKDITDTELYSALLEEYAKLIEDEQ